MLIYINSGKSIGETKDIQYALPEIASSNLCVGDNSNCCDCDFIVATVGRDRFFHISKY